MDHKNTKRELKGLGKKEILIIGESPADDLVGSFFRDLLAKEGIDLHKDCWEIYAVRCRKSEPSKNDIQCCKPYVDSIIREKKPKFIWLLGDTPLFSLFHKDWSNISINRWRAIAIPDQKLNSWIVPLYHPLEGFNHQDDRLFMSQFIRDLKFAIKISRTTSIYPKDLMIPDTSKAQYTKEVDQIINTLETTIKSNPEFLFFDYETTGLKPYRTDHRIGTISFTTDQMDTSFAFPYQHPIFEEKEQKHIGNIWKQLLLTKSKKVAHNMQFEDIWSRIIAKVEPRSWNWCTMQAAHILDNRPKYTGLKFQTYINFGIPDYSKSISSYLKENPDTPGYNRIFSAPINELLKYGSIDSLVTKFLYYLQKPLFDDHLENGLDLFVEGILALADVQINGFNVDIPYYKKAHEELLMMIASREKDLLHFPECKEFFKSTGRMPNLGSSDDLRLMFYDILKLKPPKTTEKGNKSVDAEAMSALKSPLASEITALSQIKKIDGTYMKQFMREIDSDGRIHPNFNLHFVKTYRSSSDSPNLQNVPVRNEEAKRYTRSGIIPSKGHMIVDFDYSAIEVKMGCVYTLDPVLIAYCRDDTTDMHRDTAADLFVLDHDKVTKKLRFFTKNGFVFPEWYGSYYGSCAKSLWKECRLLETGEGIILQDHLIDVGVLSNRGNHEESFRNHVKKVEEDYWKKFNVFKYWQESWYNQYEKTGIVELKTGFRCKGYLSRNAIVNYAFQGTAFHCLLWSLIQIASIIREEKLQSKVIGQIHDCCILDMHPSEYDYLISLCTEIATKELRERFPWINIPLAIEWEKTEVDSPWYMKEEFKEKAE